MALRGTENNLYHLFISLIYWDFFSPQELANVLHKS